MRWRYRYGCRYRLALVIPTGLSSHGQVWRIADNGALRVYRCCVLLVLNLSRSTLSNVNLTVCVHYVRSESVTLRLMPPDGWGKRVEQLSLEFQRYIRRNGCRMRGSGGEVRRLTKPARRGREQTHEQGEKNANTKADESGLAGTWCFMLEH